nr:EGF calcium-binding domain containing protein [Haemonchus contortus]
MFWVGHNKGQMLYHANATPTTYESQRRCRNCTISGDFHVGDINECETGEADCEQKCINIPGSYQCICDRGYTVGTDGKTCVDIDECKLWAGAGLLENNDLCMGGCINTKGSYLCKCPPGYKIQPDGRTCVDIDECALGECQGHDRICVNTLGHYKCHHIVCPENYVHDSNYKNRCNRLRSVCAGLSDAACKARYPVHITWQYIAIPKGIAITSHRPTITLFTIKGPAHNDSIVQFELNLKRAIPESPAVLLAIRQNFLLQKGRDRNSAVIAVRDTLDGPQTIELELILRLTKRSQFTGKYIANLILMKICMAVRSNMWKAEFAIMLRAFVKKSDHLVGGLPGVRLMSRGIHNVQDGYSCLKSCKQGDAACLGNHTEEILYQFRALPSTKSIINPIEVSRIRTLLETPFSVSYYMDRVGRRHFTVEQDQNIGIVKLIRPLKGPKEIKLRVDIHTKSKTGAILAYNVALIEVDVSEYQF